MNRYNKEIMSITTPYRKTANPLPANGYGHGLFMLLKRWFQKTFLVRKPEDRKFAANFWRLVHKEKTRPDWLTAERALGLRHAEKYVAYGFMEDTPSLKVRTLWILRAKYNKKSLKEYEKKKNWRPAVSRFGASQEPYTKD